MTGDDGNATVSPQHHFGLRRLEVESFKCVESATLEFGPGLNVLYGPNDLGKSSLGEAIRAVLLLPSSSSERKSFEAWGAAKPTRVRLSFMHRGGLWRVDKTWGEGTRAAALLERSSDGNVWSKEETGRAVDAELRKMLGWGVREPGGRGAPKGLPKSFITTALLGANSRIEELFAETLADDTDPAGRERLSEALQSLAEDPLFKRILTVAQERVEKSKDSRGNWRRGREAPLGRIAERIRELAAQHESLMRQAEQSESVHEVLRSHRERRAALLEALEAARVGRDRLQAAYEAGAIWRTAQAALESARAQLDGIDRELARVAALRAEADAARAEAAACIERGEAAAGAVAAAEQGQRHAAETLAALERDDGAAARVDELRRRELTLSRDRQRLAERTEQLGAALALEAAAGTDTGRAEAADAASRRAEHEHAALVTELAAKTRAQAELEQLVALVQWREATALAERTEQANTNAKSLAARARLLREAATRRRAELDRSPAPDRATLDLLTEREARLRRAEDQAAVGFAVRLTLADGRTVSIAADGAAALEVTGESTHVASRELTVDLGATGSIHVEAGSATLRSELQRARSDWDADGAPILAAFGVADLPALSELAARWHAQADQCAKDEAQATALEREAAAGAVDDAALAAVRASMQRATEALRASDARELDVLVAALSAAVGTRTATELHAAHVAGRTAVDDARARLAQAELERGLAVAEAERARLAAAASVAKADAARRALPPALAADLVTARAESEDELAELAQKLTELATAIDEAASRGQQATAGARAQLEAATAAVTVAKAEALEHEVRVAAARERAAATGARADEAAAAASSLSRETTAALVAKLEAECAALPTPSASIDADALAAATAAIAQLEQQVRDTDAEIQKAEGSLEQIGGPTMRRRADETAGELAEAKQIEADLQRDFEGWQLLRDTLRAVETEQGAHLGNALGGAVETRLRRLTAGRYGRLDLDRDLRAQGLRIAGSPRALDVLSAGLKEQLATLIRLAIAEHLDASVILDDHLAQTDPDRVEFFRTLLREVGEKVQIVVLTCRPLDYLEVAELPVAAAALDQAGLVRAVDLGRVIARGGAAGP